MKLSDLPVKYVRVGFVRYEFRKFSKVHPFRDDYKGVCDKAARVIWINFGLLAKPEDLGNVLLHEIRHAIFDFAGLDGSASEEEIIDLTTNIECQVI